MKHLIEKYIKNHALSNPTEIVNIIYTETGIHVHTSEVKEYLKNIKRKDQLILEYQKLSGEIFAFALLINQHTDYCIFFNFSGHIGKIDIELCHSKVRYLERIFKGEIKTNFLEYHKQNPDDTTNWLKAQRDVLKTILEDEEIPYHLLTEHIEQQIEYSF